MPGCKIFHKLALQIPSEEGNVFKLFVKPQGKKKVIQLETLNINFYFIWYLLKIHFGKSLSLNLDNSY